MNHKRRRPKNRRAGCLMCKPHKANHADRRTMQERKLEPVRREIAEWQRSAARLFHHIEEHV